MGEGLYMRRDGVTRFIDYDDWNGQGAEEHDDDLRAHLYGDVLAAIVAACPPPFEKVTQHIWDCTDARVLCESPLYRVTISEDSYSRLHVTVHPRDDLDEDDKGEAPRARVGLEAVSTAFFERLAETYPLHARSGPWTSEPAPETPRPTRCTAWDVTFETVTAESLEIGDAETRGYVVHNVTLREAVEHVKDHHPGNWDSPSHYEPSESPGNGFRWITAHWDGAPDPEDPESYVEFRSIHIPDHITPSSRARLLAHLRKS